MSYRIDYGNQQKQLPGRMRHSRLHVLTLLSFLLFFLLVNVLWPEGAEYIQKTVLLFREKTAEALNILEMDFLFREPLSAAFSDVLQVLRQ